MTPCVRILWRLRQNKVDFCLGQHIMTWSLFVRNERSLRGVLPNQLVEIWLEDDKAGLVEHNSVKLCLLPPLASPELGKTLTSVQASKTRIILEFPFKTSYGIPAPHI